MEIKEYCRPKNIEEAYRLLCQDGAEIVGGGVFLSLGDKKITKAVDVSGLGLRYIEDKSDRVEIGAASTLRDIELSEVTRGSFDGMLAKAASSIMGIQLRNAATIGGSVCGRYGFSDTITVLLAMDAQLELYKAGTVSLESFLIREPEKDILTKIVINKRVSKAFYEGVRNVSTDFPLLNAAIAIVDGSIRLCIGARPGRARLAKGAMSFLNGIDAKSGSAGIAAILAAEELTFGTDAMASEVYRRELCKTLVRHCVMEVLE